MSRPIRLGAVAYDPKVVTIWTGFRDWFRSENVDFDFVLYSNYESQVEDLLDGRIDVAWNSPLAWVRARRLAVARELDVPAIAMRDTDRDLTSVIVTRNDSAVGSIDDLRGRLVAVGAVDSPQATLLPLSLLRAGGLDLASDIKVEGHEVGVGLHGDHIGGEREAAASLARGQADAACMTDSNLLLFSREGTLTPGSTRVIARTDPYDHCNMTAAPGAAGAELDDFVRRLLEMSYADARVRPLLDLEGLTQWLPGRTTQYETLERAVNESAFYDEGGEIRAAEYRP